MSRGLSKDGLVAIAVVYGSDTLSQSPLIWFRVSYAHFENAVIFLVSTEPSRHVADVLLARAIR